MFARQRATVAGNQPRRLLDESPVVSDATFLGEREVDADVYTPVPEVAVGQPVQSMISKQPIEIPQVGAEVLRWHCCVLPAGIGRSGQTDARQSGTVFPDLP